MFWAANILGFTAQNVSAVPAKPALDQQSEHKQTKAVSSTLFQIQRSDLDKLRCDRLKTTSLTTIFGHPISKTYFKLYHNNVILP
jgi:hypothetical protein